MKRGYNKDTNLYPRGNASPLVKVDSEGKVDGKLLYPPWWPRYIEAYSATYSLTLSAEAVGIIPQTAWRWRTKCPHLQAEIDGIREDARQQLYDRVRKDQGAHRKRLVSMGERLDQHPNPEGDANAIRAMEAITRGLDTERKAAERKRDYGNSVVIQNNQTVGEERVTQVYTDAERSEIADILKQAGGEPEVIDGEIVEGD